MALLKAFQKQLEKKPCPACGALVPNGTFRSHVNSCKIDSSDEDCKVLAKISPEDKKRIAIEQTVQLDESPPKLAAEFARRSENLIWDDRENKKRRLSDTSEGASPSKTPLKRPKKGLIENAKRTPKKTGNTPKKRDEAILAKKSVEVVTLEESLDGDSKLNIRTAAGVSVKLGITEHPSTVEGQMTTTLSEEVSVASSSGEAANDDDEDWVLTTVSKPTVAVKRSFAVVTRHRGKKKPGKPKAAEQSATSSSVFVNVEATLRCAKVKKTDAALTNNENVEGTRILRMRKESEAGKDLGRTDISKGGEPKDEDVRTSSKNKSKSSEEAERLVEPLTSVEAAANCSVDSCSNVSLCSSMSQHTSDGDTSQATAETRIVDFLKDCKCELSRIGNDSVPELDADTSDENAKEPFSPYYLVLFLRILKKVFYSDSPDNAAYPLSFWGQRLDHVHHFITLSEPAKQLFVRMLLRKRKWLRGEKLRYSDIAPASLAPFLEELEKAGLAQSSTNDLTDLTEAVGLLQSASIRVVAKQFKLDLGFGKNGLSRSLLKMSKQKNVFGYSCAKQMLKTVKTELGTCYRIRDDVWRFFNAVLTLHSPVDMNSSNLLDNPSVNLASQLMFLLLQLSIKKVHHPGPSSPPLISIYSNFDMLMRYVEAKELEGEIAELQFASKEAQWNSIRGLAAKARKAYGEGLVKYWEVYSALPCYLRRFTDMWIYARCVAHGVDALQRLRRYDEAVEWLRYLLFTEHSELFACNKRGNWWDRLALNLDAHLKEKADAMDAVKLGLADPALGDKDRLLLQDRGMKLDVRFKGCLVVPDPERVDITGRTLGKALGDSRVNHFVVERNGTCCEASVEVVALDHYVNNFGYKEGVHAEGSVWHTIFGLLCYDVIFDFGVPNVWISESQLCPLDANTRDFYENRRSSFERRFAEIERSSTADLLASMEMVFQGHYGETNLEINWECFSGFEQITRFMNCCPPSVLVAVFRRVTTDYRNCRSGFPDLTVWNDTDQKLAVVEVKGPGDRLSTKQRLWLHYFKENNVIAHVCHVEARNPKRVN